MDAQARHASGYDEDTSLVIRLLDGILLQSESDTHSNLGLGLEQGLTFNLQRSEEGARGMVPIP
eukprot:943158-Amphidinium_carterae.1